MDTVLGVSMAPTTVRIVLVEGENADGATVDEDNFAVTDGEDPATFSAPDQVVAAILGTREGANEAGYELLSTGVTWTDQRSRRRTARRAGRPQGRERDAGVLVPGRGRAGAVDRQRDRICPRNALLYVEPDAATLAVVDTATARSSMSSASICPTTTTRRCRSCSSWFRPPRDSTSSPRACLVVGSGVDIPLIKPALEGATSLPLSVPEQPEWRWPAAPRWPRRMRRCSPRRPPRRPTRWTRAPVR